MEEIRQISPRRNVMVKGLHGRAGWSIAEGQHVHLGENPEPYQADGFAGFAKNWPMPRSACRRALVSGNTATPCALCADRKQPVPLAAGVRGIKDHVQKDGLFSASRYVEQDDDARLLARTTAWLRRLGRKGTVTSSYV